MKTLIAAALAAALAAPAAAQVSDDGFASGLANVRDLVYRPTDGLKARFQKTTQETGPNDPLLLMQKPLLDLVKKVEPSVVFLVVDPSTSTKKGAAHEGKGGQLICTGFFVDASKTLGKTGVVATNSHCVEMMAPGDPVNVGLFVGNQNRPKMTKGRVLAYGDSAGAKDVGLVEIADASLARPGLPLWTKLDVGEQVVAIGNPRGLTFSVSKGIVSALGRDHVGTSFALSMDQTDAAVNPGNSGGPLFNMWGSVVGINSAIETESGGFEGISFSLPARFVDAALRQYARTGNLKPGAIQMILGPQDDALTAVKVMAGGPAEAAGFKEKDKILSIGGDLLTGMDPADATTEFIARVKYMSPGEKVKIVVSRDGQMLTLEATVGEAKKTPERPEWAPLPKPNRKPAPPAPKAVPKSTPKYAPKKMADLVTA